MTDQTGRMLREREQAENTMRQHLATLVVGIVLGILLVTAGFAGPPYADQRDSLDRQFQRHLQQIAGRCEQEGLHDERQQVLEWGYRDPSRLYVFLVPDHTSLAGNAESATGVVPWWEDFQECRRDHASQLFALASEQLRSGHAAATYRLLFEVLREDPDHVEARRMLGYRRDDGSWQSAYTRKMRAAGRVNHSHFGWLPQKQIHRYEAGQRFYRGRWITAEQEEQFRGRMTNGWLVETEHYVVKTNHSLSAGVKLGRRLEWLYDVWQQLYVSYYSSDEILRRRLREDAINTSPRRKYKVVFYRNRSEYVRDLKKYQPQIAKTLGIYLGRQRTAYFFANEDADDATLFHEATHQLFQENGPGRKNSSDDIGADDNFWILEGIALYMESLQLHGGYATLGGVDTDRLQFARHNLYCGGFYEPLGRLTELGREELQGHPQIGQIYSQSAGLTQFFMHARKGAYRSSLLQYLKRVYERRDRTETLAELTTLTYGELDQAYRTSLNVRDPDLAGLRSLGSTKRLLLGRTQLTDDGVQWLRDAQQLQDLNLDGTAITDESLEVIGRLTQLEELDISGTRISNDGLRYLQDMQRLRVLWLSRTLVTDPCIDHLQALQGLRELHVEDTELSSTTLQSLQQLLPSVKIIQ